MYTGWICLSPTEDADIIKECEITLLKKEEGTGKAAPSFECNVTDEGMEKLDKYWHRIYWGLEKV